MTATPETDSADLQGMDLDELGKAYQQRLFDLNAERHGVSFCENNLHEARNDLKRQRRAFKRAAARLERCHNEVRERTKE